MGRLVEPVENVASPIANRKGQYAETVAKYVPAEIVAGYLPISRLLQTAPLEPQRRVLEWLAVGVGVVLSWIYFSKLKTAPEQERQVVISTVAFVLWAAALGGPFATLPGYREYIPAVILALFTWAMGRYPPRRRVKLGAAALKT
jgi:hypothetical protein